MRGTPSRVRTIVNTAVRPGRPAEQLRRRVAIDALLPDIADDADDGPPGAKRLGRESLSDLLSSGSSLGQNFLATLLLTMATGAESGVSVWSKYRPLTSGILSVSK